MVRDLPRAVTSLDRPVGEDEDATVGDLVAAPAEDPLAELDVSLRNEALEHALAELPERDAQVLRLRFGLGDEEPRTLDRHREDARSVPRAGPPDRGGRPAAPLRDARAHRGVARGGRSQRRSTASADWALQPAPEARGPPAVSARIDGAFSDAEAWRRRGAGECPGSSSATTGDTAESGRAALRSPGIRARRERGVPRRGHHASRGEVRPGIRDLLDTVLRVLVVIGGEWLEAAKRRSLELRAIGHERDRCLEWGITRPVLVQGVDAAASAADRRRRPLRVPRRSMRRGRWPRRPPGVPMIVARLAETQVSLEAEAEVFPRSLAGRPDGLRRLRRLRGHLAK